MIDQAVIIDKVLSCRNLTNFFDYFRPIHAPHPPPNYIDNHCHTEASPLLTSITPRLYVPSVHPPANTARP
ncbi:TPA: hypothetical protein ACQVH3_005256, partial [Serratia marcescens]